jgi:hypothetical protein
LRAVCWSPTKDSGITSIALDPHHAGDLADDLEVPQGVHRSAQSRVACVMGHDY